MESQACLARCGAAILLAMSISVSQAELDFEHFLVEKGLRLTAPRRKIVKMALAEEGAFTAEKLWELLSKATARVSRATVFRTVKLLAEAGALKAVDTGDGAVVYLSKFSRKTTLTEVVCSDCGRIEVLEAPFIEWYGKAAAKKCGLEAQEARVQIKGLCVRKKLGKCPYAKGH